MLTRRLGPSPPPPQPCEALIFSNYAQARPTLAHWREGHHSPKITFHRTSPTSPDIFSPHNISIPCERNQSTKLLCAAGLSALAGTAALWPGVVLAGRHPGAAWRRRLETSGASSSFLQAPKERSSSCWRLRLLHPSPASPPPLRHRLLLVGRLEMELRRRRL